jgi:Kef-type K+ transport system membrane component KefB
LGSAISFLLAIVSVAILTKIVGCFLGARVTGFDNIESLRVGVGMISRGEVGLIIAGVGLSRGILSPNMFSVMVIMVLVTTMITPILLRYVFPRVQEVPGEVFESIGSQRMRQKDKN